MIYKTFIKSTSITINNKRIKGKIEYYHNPQSEPRRQQNSISCNKIIQSYLINLFYKLFFFIFLRADPQAHGSVRPTHVKCRLIRLTQKDRLVFLTACLTLK